MSLPVAAFDGSPAEWNGFVGAARGATHCHRWEWLDVIREALGHETMALAVRQGGVLEGVLPLVRVRTRLFGHYLVSMPFLNDGGPLGSSAAVTLLVEEARRLGRDGRVNLLELRCREPIETVLRVSHRKITVILPLDPDPDLVFGRFPAKLRSQVRRPEREGVEYRFGADQVGDFYRVFAHHMRDLGTPVLSSRFFEGIAQRFGDAAWFGVARLDGAPIAAGAGFRQGEEFEITWASSLRSHSRIAPNMGLYWTFMSRAAREGCTRFNFGRCTPGGGTHKFKRQWGGEDVQLHWYQDGPAGLTPTPDQGGLMQWAPKVWSRLPLPIANALGPHIVRGIP